MSGMCRIVVGSGTYMPGAHANLAMRLADHVRRLGMRVIALEASRVPSSQSRYLTFTDGGGRSWIVRISNHRKPAKTDFAVPHLDLVSIDGVAGLDEGRSFIDRLHRGEVLWWDPVDTIRHPKPRRRHR